ncbi:MAG: sigma 54-interacting transcriptional regulator [Gammaproteobacteria bacterium]|nr:sigma 54-interacting transcriptional regulator [Gammaproteobacteria bacterium]
MKTPPRILLVDDDPGLLRLLSIRLLAEGYEIEGVDNGAAALDATESFRPDVVITDLRMENVDGIELLQSLQGKWPGLPVLLMTAHGTIPDAVKATQCGAFGFITKPIDKNELLDLISRAIKVSRPPDTDESNWRAQFITRSPVLNSLLDKAHTIAASNSRVAIFGESGVGKELLAESMHRASPQKNGRFVVMKCSAMAENLLEAELFGRTADVFADQPNPREGLFQQAQDGILLLDEIGDMPVRLQVKLLRVIEENAVRPVGSSETVPVNARIFSTTNKDLRALIMDGRFREDLYYRLTQTSLTMPALHEHAEDIPVLANSFLDEHIARLSRPRMVYAPEAIECLMSARLPGNVRQLKNLVKEHVSLCRTPVISAELVRDTLGDLDSPLPSFAVARDEFIRSYLARLLKMTGGNVTQAARMAKRNRTDFYKLLARHQLDPEVFKHSHV